MKLADVNEKKIKVVGHGHSPSNIACTDDYMISLKNFDRIIDVTDIIFLVSYHTNY